MWYIILYYMVIFKFPVSANMFHVRSVADMTNIHRTKMIPSEPPFSPDYKATTCINIPGRFEGGTYKNQERVCNTIQRRPETKRQVRLTTRLLLYSRKITQMPPKLLHHEPPVMVKPQMMLPKQTVRNNLRYQNVASTPQPVNVAQKFQASRRPAERTTKGGTRQAVYNVNEGNRDYQEYFPQAGSPFDDHKDKQEYQLFPQAAPTDNGDMDQHEYQSLPSAVFSNDRNQEEFQQLQGAVNLEALDSSQQLFPKAYSTSTAAPIFNLNLPNDPPNRPTNEPIPPDSITDKSTTSTMPPFPGGFVPPGGDFSGEQAEICGGKAKCNQYVWTTRKGHKRERTTEELLLWTP